MAINAKNNQTKKTAYVTKKSVIALKNETGFIKAVKTKPYKSVSPNIRMGETFDERLPFRVRTGEGPSIHKQPLVDKYVTTVLNIDRTVAIDSELLWKETNIDQYFEEYVRPMISQVGADVSLAIAKEGMLCPGFGGAPGMGGNVDTIRNIGAHMTSLSVPAKRTAVIEPYVTAGMHEQIQPYNMGRAQKAVVNAQYKGMAAGFNIMETAHMGTQPTGDRGAAGSITYASHVANGMTNTCTMTLGAALGGKLFAGENFTMAGVDSVNPSTRETTNQLAQFSLLKDAEAGATTLELTTDINDGTNTTTNALGNVISLSAYQNVAEGPVAGAPLTFVGASNMNYQYSLLFNKEAICFYPIRYTESPGFTSMTTETDPDTGLSMTMFVGGDINEREETTRIDFAGAVKLAYPELCYKMYS